MNWFGEPWPSAELRAPICEDDALRIPTPVGEICYWCNEAIEDGDRGETATIIDFESIDGPRTTSIGYQHIECSMRQVVGGPAHLTGTCTCCGGTDDPDLGLGRREAALAVWVLLHVVGEVRP